MEKDIIFSPYAQVFIKVDGMAVCLKLSDIIYLEVCGKQVKIVTTQGTYMPYATLSHLEEGLYPEFFWRVHRAFIINRLHIITIKDSCINMGAHTIPIGESYEKQVLKNTRPLN